MCLKKKPFLKKLIAVAVIAVAIVAEAVVVAAVAIVVVTDAAIAAEDNYVGAALDFEAAFFREKGMQQKNRKKRPIFGAGPEWTELLEKEMLENFIEFRSFELIPENFIGRPFRKKLLKMLNDAETPVLIHSVDLSLGTDEPLKKDHLEAILEIGDQVNMVSLSDHLSMTEAGGIEIGQLTPIPWSIKTADIVIRKIEAITKRITVPFALEHTAHKFFYSTSELSEPDFINRILDRTGCELILDLHNVYCNAKNAQYDPYEWLSLVNIDRTNSIHLAGGYIDKYGILQDAHDESVPEPVWEMLDVVLQKVTPQAITVERTGNYPGIELMLLEVERAEKALRKSLKEKENIERGQSSSCGDGL